MSIRPEIVGFSFTEFKNMFGSTNESHAKEMFSDYKDKLSIIDGEKQYEISAEEDEKFVTEALIFGGQKVELLEETKPSILLRFIYLQPDVIYTDSNIWRYYHWEYFEKLRDKLDPKIEELIEYFLNGRTFFIGGTPTTEFPYAYLTLNEIGEILEDMEKNWGLYDDEEGFGKDLKDWLTKISAGNKDLFFYQW